jgi:hypothetical protein
MLMTLYNLGVIPSYFGYEMNALIFNGNVFVPVPDNQVIAYYIKSAYQSQMPGYNIITIAIEPDVAYPNGAGNVHCLTMNIPPADPILMSKMNLTEKDEDLEFSMEIRTKSGVEDANIFYKKKDEK